MLGFDASGSQVMVRSFTWVGKNWGELFPEIVLPEYELFYLIDLSIDFYFFKNFAINALC